MKRNRSIPPVQVIPVLTYPDVEAAVAWLRDAFGATEHVRIGPNHRAQMMFGTGAFIIADATRERVAPSGDGVTHSVMVRVDDVDALVARAKKRNAEVVMEPTDMPFGERQCTLRDLAGHRWTFSQTIADSEPESWGGTTVTPYP
jgi:uncharacterized glyoxalase superfamily protein PhnB